MTLDSQRRKNIELKSNQLIKKIINIFIIGIGIGVLTGSLLRSLPKKRSIDGSNSTSSRNNELYINTLDFIKSNNELTQISIAWKKLETNYKNLDVSGFLLLEDGRYAGINSSNQLPAASSIKIFILVLCLELIDEGILQWDQKLILTKDIIAGGSGWMRYQKEGKEFPIYEVATEMIRVSDNTATNLLIKAIGGLDIVNQRLTEIGLNETRLNNLLPDLDGTNITTAKELALILQFINDTEFLSIKSRYLFRDVMSTSKPNSLIPNGILQSLKVNKQGNIDYNLLIKGFRVFNKTGDIGIAYADAAIIQMPDNSNAFAGFVIKGPFNDPRSADLIREMTSEMISLLKN